jgi:hypothetical protein
MELESRITQAAFARLAGVKRQAIGPAVKRGVVIKDDDGKIDTKNPVNQTFLAKRHGHTQGYNAGGRPRKDGTPTKEADFLAPYCETTARRPNTDPNIINGGNLPPDRGELELKKLEASILQMELKNQHMRSELIDFKFVDSVFHSCLQTAIEQFMDFPDSILDEIINTSISEGRGCRAKLLQKMNERINKINLGVGKQWKRNTDRIMKELNAQAMNEG